MSKSLPGRPPPVRRLETGEGVEERRRRVEHEPVLEHEPRDTSPEAAAQLDSDPARVGDGDGHEAVRAARLDHRKRVVDQGVEAEIGCQPLGLAVPPPVDDEHAPAGGQNGGEPRELGAAVAPAVQAEQRRLSAPEVVVRDADAVGSECLSHRGLLLAWRLPAA